MTSLDDAETQTPEEFLKIEASRPSPTHSIPNRRGLATVAFLVVVLWGIGQAKPFLLPLCLAGLLAFLMAPLVRMMKRYRFPEWVAITVSAVFLILPFIGLGFGIVKQGQSLIEDFPAIIKSVSDFFSGLAHHPWAEKLGLGQTGAIELSDIVQKISSRAGQGIALIIGGVSAVLSAGTQTALILLLAVLMLGARVHLRRSAERIMDQVESVHSPTLLDGIVSLIQRFLVSRILIVLIVGAPASAILAFFGYKYAFLLGSLVGIMTLVPAVGFILSLIPVIIVGLAGDLSIPRVGVSLGVLTLLNLIDNYVLTPKLVGNRVNLNALATFIGLLGGGLLWGMWGMLLSIPVLAVLRIAWTASPSLQPWGDLLAESNGPHFPGIKRKDESQAA